MNLYKACFLQYTQLNNNYYSASHVGAITPAPLHTESGSVDTFLNMVVHLYVRRSCGNIMWAYLICLLIALPMLFLVRLTLYAAAMIINDEL